MKTEKEKLTEELIQAYKEKCDALEEKCNALEAIIKLNKLADQLKDMQIGQLQKTNKRLNSLVDDALAVAKEESIRRSFEGPTNI